MTKDKLFVIKTSKLNYIPSLGSVQKNQKSEIC